MKVIDFNFGFLMVNSEKVEGCGQILTNYVMEKL
jgi:hypothetical protein